MVVKGTHSLSFLPFNNLSKCFTHLPTGKPKTCWGDDVRKDIQNIKVPNWKTLAQDRRRWRKLVEKAKTLQGVSRLEDITAGGDFLGLCDQKSLYKHVSDFVRLQSYGHF